MPLCQTGCPLFHCTLSPIAYTDRMRSQRGNILFLILLAVVLFAALTYAVTSSTRGSGRDASKESLQSTVAQISNFGMSVRAALLRMTTTGGFQPWQIDYSKANFTVAGANTTSCTTSACKLHDPAGGAIGGYTIPSNLWGDATTCGYITGWKGQYYFQNISVKGLKVDTERDLMLMYPGVSKALCIAVNDANGVANPGGNPPVDTAISMTPYGGNLTQEIATTGAVSLGDEEASITGKQMFCAEYNYSGNPGCYNLYFSLIER